MVKIKLKLGRNQLKNHVSPEDLITEIEQCLIIFSESSAIKEELCGAAFLKLLGFIFGEENRKKIYDFYSGNLEILVERIFPYIFSKLYKQAKKQLFKIQKKELLNEYKFF